MTAGQQLIQQGLQQSLEQGRQLGVEQGRQLGVEQGLEQGRQRIQELLLRLLRQRFGAGVDRPVEQRLAAASSDQLETWSLRVLTAATLTELFAP